MSNYSEKDKIASRNGATRWKVDRETTDTPVEVFNVRRCRQARGPHFVRVDVHLAGFTIFNVLASQAGVAWPMRHGDPVVAIHDEALRRRVEHALRQAARIENAGLEAPA